VSDTFDIAVKVLRDAVDEANYAGYDTLADDCIKAIAVLEAAAKVDVKAGIKEMGDLIIAAQKAARSSEASHD